MATSSIEVTNGTNCSSSSCFTTQRVNSLDDPLVFDENNLKIMSELASSLSAVATPQQKILSKCFSQINPCNNESKNRSMTPSTDGIEDLFEAYNISSDDLTYRYKIAEEHITSELNEMFVERERLRGQMQPFLNSTDQGGTQSTLQVCYVPAIATSNASQSVINGGGHQESSAALKLSGKVNSNTLDLLPPSCFNGFAKTSNLANSMLENIHIKDEGGSFMDPSSTNEAKHDSRFAIPRSEVMEKSLFINLSFKAGFNSAVWDSTPPLLKNGKDVENGAKSIYRCVECGAAYASRTALFHHFRRRIQNVKQLQCNKCVLPVTNECASRAHSRFHFLTGPPFVCFICGETCSGDSQLLQHIDMHGVECRIQNNIACHACLLVFISKEHLVKHRDSNLCKANSDAVAKKCSADLNNGSHFKTDTPCLKGTAIPETEGKGAPTVNSSSNLNCGINASVGFGTSSHKSSSVSSSTPSAFVPLKKPTPSVVATPPSTQQMMATASSNGTTCHLCQKVLSRRDKLKWHLAICAPRFQVDLYDHLLVAGFSESVARNVVLGSNCTVRCRKCSARFSTRSALEEHESACVQDQTPRSDTGPKGSTEEGTGLNLVNSSNNGVSPGGNSNASSKNTSHIMTSSSNAVLTNGKAGSQLPAMDRLTCHLCNRTLSRRDKLKRHLVRCCEMYGRDVEIALNVAGFTSKDVDKILGINNSVAVNGSALNNVGTLLAPLPTQCPPSSMQSIDTFAFEDVGAVPQSEIIDAQNTTSSIDPTVATEKLTKYHLSPENIPVPPSFSADISSLVSPTSNNSSSCDVNTSNNETRSTSDKTTSTAVHTVPNYVATSANIAASTSSLSNQSQSCQSFSCSGTTNATNASNSSALDSNFNNSIAKNSHNQTAVPSTPIGLSAPISTAIPLLSLANVVGSSAINGVPGNHLSPKLTAPSSSKTSTGTFDAKTENVNYEMSEFLQEAWDKKPSVKRMKYNCEKCGEIFSYKLAFSKHTCHANDLTTQ